MVELIGKYHYRITADNEGDDFNVVIPYEYAKQLFNFMTTEFHEETVKNVISNMDGSDSDAYETYERLIADGITTEDEIVELITEKYEDFIFYDCDKREYNDIEECFYDVMNEYEEVLE